MCSIKFVLFFVVQVMIVLAEVPRIPETEIPQEKWDGLTKQTESQLDQLATEQGHRFKLVQIVNAQERVLPLGLRFVINGQFEPASGKQIECMYQFWKPTVTGYEQYNLFCGEDEYAWSVGTPGA